LFFQILREKSGSKLSQSDNESLAKQMQNVLTSIASITDLMEDEQIERLVRFVNGSFQHVLILKETRSDYRLDAKLKDAVGAWQLLRDQMIKRAGVTEDETISQGIVSSVNDIVANVPHLVRATQQLVSAPQDAEHVAAQEAAVLAVATAFQKLIRVIRSSKVSGSASFEYDVIAESLDALRDAVRSGSTRAAVENAKIIAGEIANLERQNAVADEAARRQLDDSLAGLKDMTARLLSATKDALADPSQGDKLSGIVDGMKEQVVQCSLVDTRRRRGTSLKDRLVECAHELSVGIDSLADETG
jgi:hypothetical protein